MALTDTRSLKPSKCYIPVGREDPLAYVLHASTPCKDYKNIVSITLHHRGEYGYPSYRLLVLNPGDLVCGEEDYMVRRMVLSSLLHVVSHVLARLGTSHTH